MYESTISGCCEAYNSGGRRRIWSLRIQLLATWRFPLKWDNSVSRQAQIQEQPFALRLAIAGEPPPVQIGASGTFG
jgi:hypothetical protein